VLLPGYATVGSAGWVLLDSSMEGYGDDDEKPEKDELDE
jgi:hypothetical protein